MTYLAELNVYHIFQSISAPDYKALHQKLNAICSFFMQKAHHIIRRIK